MFVAVVGTRNRRSLTVQIFFGGVLVLIAMFVIVLPRGRPRDVAATL